MRPLGTLYGLRSLIKHFKVLIGKAKGSVGRTRDSRIARKFPHSPSKPPWASWPFPCPTPPATPGRFWGRDWEVFGGFWE